MTLASAGPIVSIKGDRAFANSRDVAEFFEKEHRSVLRSIDDLIETDPEGMHNFVRTPYLNPQNGQSYRAFDMDQEGFTLLAMGFTGPKALSFKRLYIRAFNAAMEEIQTLRTKRRVSRGRRPMGCCKWLRGTRSWTARFTDNYCDGILL